MSFYESVVIEYLRADRALMLNTQCCVQLNPGHNPDVSGPHWYCDALACDMRAHTVFLCEITYDAAARALVKRLKDWHAHWSAVTAAIRRDSHVPDAWPMRPWLFVRSDAVSPLLDHLAKLSSALPPAFTPRITPLEMVQPWQYCGCNRIGEAPKPEIIPSEMRE